MLLHLLAYCLHLDLSKPVAFLGRSTGSKHSCSYITEEHYYNSSVSSGSKSQQYSSGTIWGERSEWNRGGYTGTLWEFCCAMAAHWTDENTQHSLTAFDLSLQVIYMNVSGLRVLLSMTLMGKGEELRLQVGCLCHWRKASSKKGSR